MERDDKRVSSRRLEASRLLHQHCRGSRGPVLGERGILHDIVIHLQVEEVLTHVAKDVGLVAVVM
jgi:hypothetical protein